MICYTQTLDMEVVKGSVNNIHSAERWQDAGEIQAPLPTSSKASPYNASVSSFVK